LSVWHKKAMLDQLRGVGSHASPGAVPTPAPLQSEPPVHVPAPIASHDILHEHAQDILEAAPDVHDAIRADAYDAFHDSRDARELAGRLQSIPLPESVALALLEAKKKATPQSTANKVFEALMALPKDVRDIAEAHPHVLGHFVKAVLGKE